MNGLNSELYNILSILQNNVRKVENVCNICGASHYTQNCPDYTIGEHVRDTTPQNMSRSSIPTGLHIIETREDGPCVVTLQKFAKGSRFGPLLAEKSFSAIENTKFPLVIFGNPLFNVNDLELEQLFVEKNVYLDTRNENKCNWMIHVSPAKFTNEQNLICFQLYNQIFYTAINDIDAGDILKVWYAPKYAAKMNAKLLQPSPYELVNNVLSDSIRNFVEDNLNQEIISYENNNNSNVQCRTTEIFLPPINSLMKSSSTINFYPNNNYVYSDTEPYHQSSSYEFESFHKFYEEAAANDMNAMAISPIDTDMKNINMSSNIMDYGGCDQAIGIEDHHQVNEQMEEEDDGNIEMTPKKKKGLAGEKNLQNARLKPAVYSCKLCNKTYVAICNLNKHHMQVHQLHLCNLCMTTFQTMESLKMHQCPNQTLDSECSKCPICYKVLANQWSLARHVKCTHKGYTISVKKKEIILGEIDPGTSDLSLTMPLAITSTESTEIKDDKSQFYDEINSDLLHQQQISLGAPPSQIANVNESSSSENSSTNDNNNKMVSGKFETISDDDIPPLVQIKPINAAIRALVSKLSKKSIKRSADDEKSSSGKKTGVKKTKETIRPHRCDECGKMYAKKDGLQKHKLTHENLSFFCPFCSHAPLKSHDSLRRHFRTSHVELQDQWSSGKGFINSCIIKTEMMLSPSDDDKNNISTPHSTNSHLEDDEIKDEFECWSPKLIFNDHSNASPLRLTSSNATTTGFTPPGNSYNDNLMLSWMDDGNNDDLNMMQHESHLLEQQQKQYCDYKSAKNMSVSTSSSSYMNLDNCSFIDDMSITNLNNNNNGKNGEMISNIDNNFDDLENIVETSTKFLAVFLNDSNLANDRLLPGDGMLNEIK